MENKKIVFISPNLSQPRCIKRVSSFFNAGCNCVVYGYERGNYDVNKYPEGVSVSVLSKVEDGTNYVSKLKLAYHDVKRIVRQYRNTGAIFYSFSMQHSMILRLLGVKYIYEISDILYAYPQFMRYLSLFKWIDKKLIKSSFKTVMTSGGFYDFYGIKSDKISVIPNKVSPILEKIGNRERLTVTGDKLRFAFIGGIRYESVARFARIIGEKFPQHTFSFYGACSPAVKKLIDFDAIIEKYGNVEYHGVFKSPYDLPSIYQNVDVVIACYDVISLNERLAEPNKLYEALYFCRPIVVSDGIFLGNRVKELKCGYAIDASSEETIYNFISSLDNNEINSISDREYNMPLSEMVDNTEQMVSHLLK